MQLNSKLINLESMNFNSNATAYITHKMAERKLYAIAGLIS